MNPKRPQTQRYQASAECLAVAAREGNREAYDQLVKLVQRQLYGLCLMMVRDPGGAEEVAQDAFIRAFTHLHLYDQKRPFYPWIATIAVRLAQNWLRKQGLVASREGSPLQETGEPSTSQDPLVELIADEGARDLWRAVAALPSGERTATYLHYRQEMKVKDIARALGVTAGTVKTLLFRARRKLRENLTENPLTDNRPQEEQT